MKFLRQKETKRKISFLMALAMMVSLLPVSPVAQAVTKQAAEPTVKILNNSKLDVEMKADKIATAGSLEITITPTDKDSKKLVKNGLKASVATGGATSAASAAAIATAATGASVKEVDITINKDGTNATFTVINLNKDNSYIAIDVRKLGLKLEDKKDTPAATATGGGIYFPGSGNTAPGTSTSPAPSASASAAPSAKPSGSAAPGTSSAPTNAPGTSSAPTATPTNAPTPTTTVKVGNKVTASNLTYKVTSVSGTRTVQFTGAKSGVKIVKIPATIKINGKSYKVTTIVKGALRGNTKVTKVIIGKNINKIGTNAFRGCKNLKTVRINVTNLTASKVKANAFKNIKKNATFKVPSGKIKKYKKIVQAKGAGKKIKVIKK